MSGLEIFGVPVILDLTLPPTSEELEQASADFTAFHRNGYGDSEECDEFGRAMEEAGYWPRCNPDNSFTFVPL